MSHTVQLTLIFCRFSSHVLEFTWIFHFHGSLWSLIPVEIKGLLYLLMQDKVKVIKQHPSIDSRIAISLEHPQVGADSLILGKAVVGAGVEVDEEEHVQHRSDHSYSVW